MLCTGLENKNTPKAIKKGPRITGAFFYCLNLAGLAFIAFAFGAFFCAFLSCAMFLCTGFAIAGLAAATVGKRNCTNHKHGRCGQ